MSRLVVDGSERADTREHLTDDESPGGGDFTVGIARWREQRTEILAYAVGTGRSLGVRLAIDTDPGDLVHDVRHFGLVVIEVRDSADGRFFSIAARVREHARSNRVRGTRVVVNAPAIGRPDRTLTAGTRSRFLTNPRLRTQSGENWRPACHSATPTSA